MVSSHEMAATCACGDDVGSPMAVLDVDMLQYVALLLLK